MWRKTRQPYGQCFGADPNRNFPIHWGQVGTSNNPCSDIYLGPRPFSEPETLAMSRYMTSIENLRMYLTFHSFGQFLLFPPVSIYGSQTSEGISKFLTSFFSNLGLSRTSSTTSQPFGEFHT